jgi:hypothetical protein
MLRKFKVEPNACVNGSVCTGIDAMRCVTVSLHQVFGEAAHRLGVRPRAFSTRPHRRIR